MTEQPTLISEPKDIKLIVIDVDNTLLNSDHDLSERNEQAIKAAIEKGVRVILATGKTHGSCTWLIEKLGIKDPGIFTQGLIIQDADGTIRFQHTMNPNIARQIITFSEDRGYAIVAYAQDRLLARTSTPYTEEIYTKWRDGKVEYVGPLQNILHSTPINKLIALSAHDERKIKALRWQLNAQTDGNAHLMSGGIKHILEIMPPGHNKGTALKALLRDMKIDPKHVMAIGDGENDVEMLKLAGIGVAVANGQQVLKDAADEITASNDDDGVAKTIERYILSNSQPATSTDDEEATTNTTDEANAENNPSPEDIIPTGDQPEVAAPKPEDIIPQADSSEE